MSSTPHIDHAIVVLPCPGRLATHEMRRWLSRGQVRRDGVSEPLARTLSNIGHTPPPSGLAALRWWGSAGRPPEGWLAAADPVTLEARLDHLCLHDVPEGDLAFSERRSLLEHLQASIGDDRLAFRIQGGAGYIAGEAFATTALPPSAVAGLRPDEFLPSGPGSEPHDRLQGELQMALHEHPVNLQRQERGRAPVNALWLWGGGEAPQSGKQPAPPLFADDSLHRGYWMSVDADFSGWPGDFAACAEQAGGGFVAVVPATGDSAEALHGHLDVLRGLLSAGRLQVLTVLFADGIAVELRRSDRFRFWRALSPELAVENAND